MRKTFERWAPPVLWAGVIFGFSAIPTFPRVEILWWDFVLKKSAHVIEYAIFFLLLMRALSKSDTTLWPTKLTFKAIVIALVVGLIYALSDEYHQSFVPGRTAKITDVGFDTLGMILSFKLIKRNLEKE